MYNINMTQQQLDVYIFLYIFTFFAIVGFLYFIYKLIHM